MCYRARPAPTPPQPPERPNPRSPARMDVWVAAALERGVDVVAAGEGGLGSLYAASYHGHAAVVRLLLGCAADVAHPARRLKGRT